MKNYQWLTFNGKLANLREIDHQHLSNCYWYSKIFNFPQCIQNVVFFNEINRRFSGKILEYLPHPDFKYEISELRNKNMLVKVGSAGFYLIKLEEEIIGKALVK